MFATNSRVSSGRGAPIVAKRGGGVKTAGAVGRQEKRGDGVTPRVRVRKKGAYLFPFFIFPIFPPFFFLAPFFFLGMAAHLPSRR